MAVEGLGGDGERGEKPDGKTGRRVWNARQRLWFRSVRENDKQKNRSNQTDTQQQTWRNVLLSSSVCCGGRR